MRFDSPSSAQKASAPPLGNGSILAGFGGHGSKMRAAAANIKPLGIAGVPGEATMEQQRHAAAGPAPTSGRAPMGTVWAGSVVLDSSTLTSGNGAGQFVGAPVVSAWRLDTDPGRCEHSPVGAVIKRARPPGCLARAAADGESGGSRRRAGC